MKIGKMLRNLLMRQSETRMIKSTKAEYLGEVYDFPKVKLSEQFEMMSRIAKNLDL